MLDGVCRTTPKGTRSSEPGVVVETPGMEEVIPGRKRRKPKNIFGRVFMCLYLGTRRGKKSSKVREMS